MATLRSGLLVALALGSCAAPRAIAPPLGDLDARVTFALVSAEPPAVTVTIAVRGDASGATQFEFAESWGGNDHLERGVRAVRAEDGAAQPLPVAPEGERAWRVSHAPGVEVRLRFEYVPLEGPVSDDGHTSYRPIVRPGLFHLIGTAGLPKPSTAGSAPIEAEFRWEGFREAGWETIHSHGDGDAVRARLPWNDLAHAVFLAGRLRVHRVAIRGSALVVAIHGDEWDFTDDEFVSLVSRIVGAERAFFDDFSDPFYLVSVIPVGSKRDSGRSLGGTGLTHSFAMFLRPNTPLADEPGLPSRLKVVLAHEFFHHWNGRVVQRVEPEELVYWFSEGFTDHFARRLLWRSGLVDDASYLALANEQFAEAYRNPKRRAPNATIREEFWTDPDVEKLPYQRGDLVAFALDREVRARSGGARGIEEFLREIVRRARERGEAVSTESLLALAADWTDANFAETLRAAVVEGAEIPLPADLAAPLAELRWVDPRDFPPRGRPRPGAPPESLPARVPRLFPASRPASAAAR